jgi:hypothetical protein
MKKLLTTVLLFYISVIPAQSVERTGADLLQECLEWKKMYEHGTSNPNVAYQAGECVAYIQGIADSLYVQKRYCPGRSIYTQRTRAVIKYLENNPTALDEDKMQLTINALTKAFPCK